MWVKMWIKPNKHVSLTETSPPDYSYIPQPHLTGRGGGVTVIYIDYECHVKTSHLKVFILTEV